MIWFWLENCLDNRQNYDAIVLNCVCVCVVCFAAVFEMVGGADCNSFLL